MCLRVFCLWLLPAEDSALTFCSRRAAPFGGLLELEVRRASSWVLGNPSIKAGKTANSVNELSEYERNYNEKRKQLRRRIEGRVSFLSLHPDNVTCMEDDTTLPITRCHFFCFMWSKFAPRVVWRAEWGLLFCFVFFTSPCAAWST